MPSRVASALALMAFFVAFMSSAHAQSPIICEDSISSLPPFNNNAIPCLLGCGSQVAIATGGLLPGSVNESAIPYCELNCVRENPSSAQSSAAPDCDRQCREMNSGTPDQLGWCMYWCVEGGGIASDVVATTCVPSLERVSAGVTTIGSEVVTILGFTNPPEWASWYQTQTVIPRTSMIGVAAQTSTALSNSQSHTTTSSDPDTSPAPAATSSIDSSRRQLFTTSEPSLSSLTTKPPAAQAQQSGTATTTSSGAAKALVSAPFLAYLKGLF